MDITYFNQALESLRLDQGWFATVPRDLLYLAMSNGMTSDVRKDFISKYGTTSYQELEFYGDRVLNLIVSMVIFQLYGLKYAKGRQDLYVGLTSNKALLNIGIEENFCQSIVKSYKCRYFETSNRKICSDSFEAIMGAIYFYGIATKKTDIINTLYTWFTSLPSILRYLSNKFNITILDLGDALNLDNHPIDYNVHIDMNDSRLWKNCQMSFSEIETDNPEAFEQNTEQYLQQPYVSPSVPKRKEGEPPGKYIIRLQRYFNTKVKKSHLDDGDLIVTLDTPTGRLIGVSETGDYSEAIKDLISSIQ